MDKSDRTYHHGDLRQTLIEAACQHLLKSGADTLSLRALARQVGVSQTAPYRHFGSKNALFAAIATYGFEQLGAALKASSDAYADDIERAIVEVGLTYIRWAGVNPEKYSLFFDSSLVEFSEHPELVEAGNDSFQVILSLIGRGIDAGLLLDKSVVQLATVLWAGIHGCASLLLSKSDMIEEFDDSNAAVEAIRLLSEDARPTMEMFVNAIKKPTL